MLLDSFFAKEDEFCIPLFWAFRCFHCMCSNQKAILECLYAPLATPRTIDVTDFRTNGFPKTKGSPVVGRAVFLRFSPTTGHYRHPAHYIP